MSDNVPVNSPRNYSVQYIPLSQVDWKAGTLQYAFNGSNGEEIYFNATVLFLVYSSLAVGLYLSVEVFILTLARFRSWKSLYFWSLIITTCAMFSDCIVWLALYLLESIQPERINTMSEITMTLIPLGFCLILYSRLHTVTQRGKRDRLILRGLLALIIVITIAFRSADLASLIRYRYTDYNWESLLKLANFNWMSDIGWALLEDLLTLIYIWFFWRYLNDVPQHLRAAFEKDRRITMLWLLACFAASFATSILRIVIHACFLRLASPITYTFVYVLRLKLEFIVLNRLAKVTEAKRQLLMRGNLLSVESPSPNDESEQQEPPSTHPSPVVSDATTAQTSSKPTFNINEKQASSAPANGVRQSDTYEVDSLERLYLGRFNA